MKRGHCKVEVVVVGWGEREQGNEEGEKVEKEK
jgi:hypothetical protein